MLRSYPAGREQVSLTTDVLASWKFQTTNLTISDHIEMDRAGLQTGWMWSSLPKKAGTASAGSRRMPGSLSGEGPGQTRFLTVEFSLARMWSAARAPLSRHTPVPFYYQIDYAVLAGWQKFLEFVPKSGSGSTKAGSRRQGLTPARAATSEPWPYIAGPRRRFCRECWR